LRLRRCTSGAHPKRREWGWVVVLWEILLVRIVCRFVRFVFCSFGISWFVYSCSIAF
jgi:hypothetical protein